MFRNCYYQITVEISLWLHVHCLCAFYVTPSGKRRVEYTVRGTTTKVPEEAAAQAAAQMDLDDEEAEPATYAIQTNLNQVHCILF